MKQAIFDRINELIEEEKGASIDIDALFKSSDLDSLGITLVMISLDTEYGIFQGKSDEDAFASFNFDTLTMRELVQLCRFTGTATSSPPNTAVTT